MSGPVEARLPRRGPAAGTGPGAGSAGRAPRRSRPAGRARTGGSSRASRSAWRRRASRRRATGRRGAPGRRGCRGGRRRPAARRDRPASPATAAAASSVQPPANTDSRRSSRWSASSSRSQLQSMSACSVCWRGTAVRRPPVRRRNRSPRPCAISAADRTLTRAAASSRASGMPSSRRQISTTGAAVVASSRKEGSVVVARSTNSRTASVAATASGSSWSSDRGHRQRRHGEGRLARHAQRLAARREDVQRAAGREQVLDELGRRLDQVLAVVEQQEQVLAAQEVDHRGDRRLARAGPGRRASGPPPATTSPGSRSGASSISQVPSGWRLGRSPATWSIRRVLPVPPTPDERHQPVPLEQRADLGRLPLPPDERGQVGRQVASARRPSAAAGSPSARPGAPSW